MKNFGKNISCLLVLSLLIMNFGCQKDFDEINTNKVNPTSLDPQIVMNDGVLLSTYPDNFFTLQMLCYNFPIVQQIVTPFGSSLSGGNYNIFNPSNATPVWRNFYQNVLKQIVDVVNRTQDDVNRSNLYNEARIWKAYAFMILSDTYGNIPYFDAGKGFIDGSIQPKYDTQDVIYHDILNEIKEAADALDASKSSSVSDILYGGDIAKWKRFGYSLLLRAGMRLSKVAPDEAKDWVQKAVTGGVLESNDDNAIIRHTSLYNNWIAVHLTAREKANFYLAQPFVNFLKDNNDPRLKSIAVRHVGALSGADQFPPRTTSDPSVQVGMPMGYDDVSIASTFSANGVASLYDYSQVNLETVLKLDAPEYHLTYSETLLLLAEAAVRNWIADDAAGLYQKGIRANLEQMADFGDKAAIAESDIQVYLNSQLLDMTNEEKALEQINTQYWVSSFLNGSESWANFRRSGYPQLAKNPYPGSEITGNFIRRIPYPDSETTSNLGNMNDAINQQGPNDLNTRIWWDK